MLTIYYTEKPNFESGEAFIRKIFNDHYGITDFAILKTPEGKPFAPETELEFSLSHTKACYFLAVSDKPVGIDAEQTDRKTDFKTVAAKYFPEFEIPNATSFLRLWTVKESAVKLVGGTIARDMKKFRFQDGALAHVDFPPVRYLTTETNGHFVTVSRYEEITETEWITYP